MTLPTLKDLDVKGKRVLVRVDYNVPIDKQQRITDDTRIRESLPTLQYILGHGGSIILMSHLGKPKGKIDPSLTLAPCATHLSNLIGKKVDFASDCVGHEAEGKASQLQPGEILLLENLRFHPAEEDPQSDPSFAKSLAALGDLFVNDAFGTAHRAHASTYTIVSHFPKKAAAGLLMEKEVSVLSSLLSEPKHPFYALIGGAKVSTKIGTLKALSQKVDALFIAGGMAFTLFKSRGLSVGDSLVELPLLTEAKDFLEDCKKRKIPVYLPTDIVIAEAISERAKTKIITIEQGIPAGWQGLDIGPATLSQWKNLLKNAQTIFWNGPFGVFELPPFSQGTFEMARFLSEQKCVTVVGGGDSVAAINALHLSKKFTHLSTGGGAALEFIEFGHLPGIDVLVTKNSINSP